MLPLYALSLLALLPYALSQGCFDNHELCGFWASIGECQANQVWMLPNCAFSCNNCGRPDYGNYDYNNNNNNNFDYYDNNNNNNNNFYPDYGANNNNPQFAASVDNNPQANQFQQQPPPQPAPQPQPSIANTAGGTARCEELLLNDLSNAAQTMKEERIINEFEGQSSSLSMNDIRSSNERSFCVPSHGGVNCRQNPCFQAMFRTSDGSCNNLNNPLQGASFTSSMRLMGAAFDDGINAPVASITNSRPSPRDIVMNVIRDGGVVDHSATNMLVMQWGQFLAHDIVKTTILPDGGCNTCNNNNVCFNVPVNPLDPSSSNFGCEGGGNFRRCCVRMSRTSPVCGTGQGGAMKQILNENTAYIDASHVYGSSQRDINFLRDGNSPFLRTSFEGGAAFPPRNGRNEFIAGDERINIFVGLAAFHTVFLREHNRVARQLQGINPGWSAERVFQEARKIVGAEMQAITYKEWLPIVLGAGLGSYSGYNPSVDPGVSLEFSTGIFRFGHGMLRESFARLNGDGSSIPAGAISFVRALNNPNGLTFEGGVDGIVRGMAVTATKMPQRITTSVTDRLFGNRDLASINLSRGRDNGIVSYNTMREFCGFGRATSFDQINEISDPVARQALAAQYNSPDDIDLFAGAIVEDPAGGLVGPTMGCVIRNQFNRLRDGDRFFYQKPGVFTPEQLNEIEAHSFARILCDNGERLGSIPSRAFNLDGPTSCSSIGGMNLNAWRES